MTRYQARDSGMYGASVGIVHVPVNIPLIPGDVGNASTFSYPVMYENIEGSSVSELVTGDVGLMAEAVVAAAQRLEKKGARAIGSDCGTLIRYQAVAAAAVDVPVFLSPLVIAPTLGATLGTHRKIAMLVASDERVTKESLRLAGVADTGQFIVQGLQTKPAWRAAIISESGSLDSETLEAEVVESVRELVAAHPDVGAFLLECADLPPYAHAIQAATGLPVYDMVSVLDWAHCSMSRRPFTGTL